MGAFSTNDRMDFRAVLSAFSDTEVPMPPREDGETPEWCEGERLMCAGGSWTPSIGQAPEGWHEGSGFSSWRILEADVPQTYYLSPVPMLPLPPPCGEGGRAAAEGDRTASFETGRQIPVIHPFQCFRMRGAAKRQEETAFRNSFGLPTDPFPTLLASDVTPFAFWYEGDPEGGCIRFLTETESERLMGLPEGWTKYGGGRRGDPASATLQGAGEMRLPSLVPITLWPGFMRCWLTGPERRNEPMFEAYITNTALYPLMGIEVGTTVHFPMTTQELQAALAKIGIDGKRYSEVFFTSFDSDVLGLYDHLYECENIDELNELGHALLEVRDKGGLETFEAALVLGNHTRSVKDLINLTQNLDLYRFYPDISDDEGLGRLYADELGTIDIPEHIQNYFDYEAYGRDVRINEGGVFAPGGYVSAVPEGFKEYYHGPQDIPPEHRIFAYPEKAEPVHSILAALKRFQEAPARSEKGQGGAFP